MTRSEVLSSVFRERPKLIALGLSMMGDGLAAEKVYQELLVAVEQRLGQFASYNELVGWCWEAMRNRLTNLTDRGDGRDWGLPVDLQDRLDDELKTRAWDEIQDQAEALEICLSDLSRWDRWIAHLHYHENKSGLETSRLVNISPENLYRDLQRIYRGGAKCLIKRIAMGRNPLGRVGAKSTEFERLVIRYLDDELPPDGIRQLGRALLEDPDRLRQFNDIRLFSAIARDSTLLGTIDSESYSVESRPMNPRLARTLGFSWVTASVILGALLIVLALIKLRPAEEPKYAVIVRAPGADFATREAPEIGDALDKDSYLLESGKIQVRFGKNAEVNIEGPASFAIDSDNRMTLNYGTILAMVPPTAVGFEVGTRLATVRDLGTEFGVIAKQGEEVQVVVFEGVVDLLRSGEEPHRMGDGDGVLLKPGEMQTIDVAKSAYRYPHTLPTSEAALSPESMAINYSFEVGAQSRAAHTSQRYRDIPSNWSVGGFFNKKWSKQVAVPGVVNAGTVFTPSSEGADDGECQSRGVRCLFLNDAAVRQEIENVQPGGQYKLRFSVKSPRGGQHSLPRTFKVGFLADNHWIVAEEGSVEPGPEFNERELTLDIPDDEALAGKPIYLVLSSESGLIYFDVVRLQPLFGGE